jgi:glycosyltransferase involved in cell wall biosynthesis
MNKKIAFVVVFHNAETYVNRVLTNILRVSETYDEIIVIADGCTDSTSRICTELLSKSGKSFQFEETADLHEIGALNAAFKMINDARFVMHLQGDMAIDVKSFSILRKIIYSDINLGVLSLRMGGCFHSDNQDLKLNEMNFGHNFKGKITRRLKLNLYNYCVVGRGPLLFNREILNSNFGKIDENLKPHSIDDLDLSLISLELGFKNYSVNLPYRSDITWGATRTSNRSFLEPVQIAADKNLLYVKEKHSKILKVISHTHTHSFSEIGNIKIGVYYILGQYINRELLQSENKKLKRIRRKIAFKLSQYTI